MTVILPCTKIPSMKKEITSDEIRQSYLSFFEEKGHKIVPSIPLVPVGDPTLLFTSAGMVPFKRFFTGELSSPAPRLTSCQKCFRTTDIEIIGDAKHLTFFEMLGNFSIGDYFKKEAIIWAWEYVTKRLEVPEERLWVTIFLDDEESFKYWRRIGVPAERIVRCDERDNFWGPAGDSGPCGPCSEIHYDLGADVGCRRSSCNPSCGCGRFTEIWNLVFTQYFQDGKGVRTPLPKPNIDTGMGLERVTAVMQNKSSVYETDLFQSIIECVRKLARREETQGEATQRAIRVVAEHARSISFLIADGVIPSNEERGYVLRRILRRAVLFGKKLGLEQPFLSEIAQSVISRMGYVYPELLEKQDFINKVIGIEEQKFGETLGAGLNWLDKTIESVTKRWGKEIPGEDAFKLYDTYGFPLELTVEIAGERGFSVNVDGFHTEMECQRERARSSHKYGGGVEFSTEQYQQMSLQSSNFTGYDKFKIQSVITDIIAEGKKVESIASGSHGEIVLKETPFYGEMGGQVGDTGEIRGVRGKFVVANATRPIANIIVHQGQVMEGKLTVGDPVEVMVDIERRRDIARNHTATHLLQAALRLVLGSHVEQKGSLVGPGRLRFDFSHMGAITDEQLWEVEDIINERIRQDLPVTCEVMPYSEAIAQGATALFGEKYGDVVRMVKAGNPAFSIELCGGTHVNATGEIGFLHIVNESSIGSGLRRIEAVTGRGAAELVKSNDLSLKSIARDLRATTEEAPARVTALVSELDTERKNNLNLQRELSRGTVESLIKQVDSIDGVKIISAKVSVPGMEMMREMGDILREKMGSGVIVLGAIYDERPNFLVMVTPDLITRGIHAGNMVKQIAKVTGGGGGGKPGIGQAGGKDKNKLDQALSLAKEIVQHALG